jgi:hypothetical protein
VDYDWFFRASWNIPVRTWQGVPFDNMVYPGSTQLTYDLNPPPPASDFEVQFFIPQTASNTTPTVDVSISGYFPNVPNDTCDWYAYLLSNNGDPSGNPADPTDAELIPGRNLVKNGDSNITVTFPLQKGTSFPGGPPIPVPATQYTLYVVRGSEARQGPVPFTVTEYDFDHWKIWPFAFFNDAGHMSVRFLVYAMDADGNVVTRPGQPPPTITMGKTTIPLGPLSAVMGRYGEYYVDTTKNAPGSGFTDILVSGGGVAPAQTTVVVPP